MSVLLPEFSLLEPGATGKLATTSNPTTSSGNPFTDLESSGQKFEATVAGAPASFGAQVAISIVIAILGVWSALGNLLTILAISTNRYMRTKCNCFIISLAVSDLISGTIASPLWLYRRTWGFQHWLWGEFFCKVFWFFDESTSYCTAMHIASFAVWRYIGVRWPHAVEKFAKRKLKIWLGSIWIVALIFGGGIFSTFYGVNDRTSRHSQEYASWPSCTVKITEDGIKHHNIYYTFSSTTFMLLPMITLFASSMLISGELFCHAQTKSRLRKIKERRAVCQLALISGSFLLGYVPMTAYVMWTTRTPHSDLSLDYWTHVAAYFSLRISECLNPIIYNIASENMRKASRKVLHWIGNCCRTDTEIDFVIHSPSCRRHSLFHVAPGLLKTHRGFESSQDGNGNHATILLQSKSTSALIAKFHRNSSASSAIFASLQKQRTSNFTPTSDGITKGDHSSVAEKALARKHDKDCTQV